MEKDSIKAAYFYSKACELKEGDGCGFLGFLYEYGQGVEKDLTKATYFYSKACKLGEQLACESLKKLR
ncbi:tetratricopeptide repeat protein [Helicobacter pylori]|uniref:tetratricopeptide repeat protein n=1 Tax=Helicobacter pylori TaxID=210 RepID=UPI003531630D